MFVDRVRPRCGLMFALLLPLAVACTKSDKTDPNAQPPPQHVPGSSTLPEPTAQAISLVQKALEPTASSEARYDALDEIVATKDKTAIKPLASSLQTLQGEMEAAVRETLHKIGAGEALAVDLKDGDAMTKEQAATLLYFVRDPKSVPGLIAALKDGTPAVRSTAANALRMIDDERAVSPLIDVLMNDADAHVRGSAATALGALGNDPALDALDKAAATEKDESVKVLIEKARQEPAPEQPEPSKH